MNPSLIPYLKQKWNVSHLRATPVGGGDINRAYCLTSEKGKNFIKCNIADRFPRMFEREAEGLRLLKSTNSIRIPKVLEYGEVKNTSFLLLEWIEENGLKNNLYWTTFGQQLATLHQNTRPFFGLSHSNYIGRLPQDNNDHEKANDFFIFERLEPQIMMAEQKDHIDSDLRHAFEQLYQKLPQILPEENPALIHGDLWSGNWMSDEKGNPALIDPAVSYAPREMDLAMLLLFGRPPSIFFESYQNIYPLASNWEECLEIYQLYYLLVHVNLFGTSYLTPIRNTLDKYV